MTRSPRDEAYLHSLVRELAALPAETPWVELKHNNAQPQEIGEYISALANAAALEGKAKFGFWEKFDDSHTVVRIATSWATKMEEIEQLIALM